MASHPTTSWNMTVQYPCSTEPLAMRPLSHTVGNKQKTEQKHCHSPSSNYFLALAAGSTLIYCTFRTLVETSPILQR